MNIIKTIIIDDERYACERLKRLLLPFKEIQIEDIFTSPQLAYDYILKQKPRLIFLDIELENNISAFDLISKTRSLIDPPDVILVTAHPHYSIRAIKNEVFDYLLKPVDIDELRETIDRYIRYISSDNSDISKKLNMLTKREKCILKHIFEGKSSSQIATILFLSVNTVHTHRRNILKKTGSGSFIDLMRINSLIHD